MAGDKLLEIMRKTAKPPTGQSTDLLFGKVTSVNPLRIKVDNRFEISSSFIILTSLVSDFSVDITVDEVTKQHHFNLGLKVNEDVLLLRVHNGQKFIIIDRVRQ